MYPGNFLYSSILNFCSMNKVIISLSNKTEADYIVRVTADNPLTEFRFIDELSNFVNIKKYFYATMDNNICPLGTNLEIFSSKALKDSFKVNQSAENFEHVTYHLKKISNLN